MAAQWFQISGMLLMKVSWKCLVNFIAMESLKCACSVQIVLVWNFLAAKERTLRVQFNKAEPKIAYEFYLYYSGA